MIAIKRACLSAAACAVTLAAGCASTPEDCDPSQPGLGRALGCSQSGAYEQRVADLRTERNAELEANAALRNERSNRAGEIRALAAERRRLVAENSELRASNQRLRERISALRGDAEVSTMTLEQADSRLRALEAERAELEALLLGDDPTINQRLDELNRQLETLRRTNRALVQLLSETGG